MTAQKATKKPVTIEFMRLTGDYDDDLAVMQWCGGKFPRDESDAAVDQDILFYIETLEGDMAARVGDVVIQGVQGEFYPCKPDIFADTYDIEES